MPSMRSTASRSEVPPFGLSSFAATSADAAVTFVCFLVKWFWRISTTTPTSGASRAIAPGPTSNVTAASANMSDRHKVVEAKPRRDESGLQRLLVGVHDRRDTFERAGVDNF